MNIHRTAIVTLPGRLAGFLIDVLTFRETRASTKRGRNQMRIAFGLGAIAAAGFFTSRLIDPTLPAFGYLWWLCVLGAILSGRTAIWLFLTIEGGRE